MVVVLIMFGAVWPLLVQSTYAMQQVSPQLKQVGPGQRYVACVRYNARVDGKYAGTKDGVATFVSGKLDRYFDGKLDVKELCKDTIYAPFPELETLTR